MVQKTMEELQRDQELLRDEVNQLKGQMTQVMEILQVLLKREGISPPIATTQVDTPLAFSFSTPAQEPHHSMITHVPMNGPSPKDLPLPAFPKVVSGNCETTHENPVFTASLGKRRVDQSVIKSPYRRRIPSTCKGQSSDMSPKAILKQLLLVSPRDNMKQNQNRNARSRGQFDPIPITYTALYPHLVELDLITTRPLTPLDPLPAGFRSDLHCEFHQGAAGHDLENCYALKARVRDLIRRQEINFGDPPSNVTNNPLPGKSG